jgi:hypothetical protein
VADYCENCNETSCSIKGEEFLNWMNDCQLHKNGFVTWSQSDNQSTLSLGVSVFFFFSQT